MGMGSYNFDTPTDSALRFSPTKSGVYNSYTHAVLKSTA